MTRAIGSRGLRSCLAILLGSALTSVTVAGIPGCRTERGSPDRPVSVVRTRTDAVKPAAPIDESGFREGEVGLTSAERVGREIWFKATGGNERFHTYVFQQRHGVSIDWFRVLGGPTREERFKSFGLINDPDCCTPGSAGCPAKTMEETYGFDYCAGDADLLPFVGKSGYPDPACLLRDAPAQGSGKGGHAHRQSACDLAFGTSTGALGFRKFPNPRFDAAKWKALNGGRLGTWEGFDRRLSAKPELSDSRVSHLQDNAIEPPFLIGMACGACHIAFDPLNPPKNPAHPQWKNLKGLVGNQYIRPSEIMASGMATDSPEWQIFTHARPGSVDTSAVPNDQVHNPGTMNALINVPRRPVFADELVSRWRRVGNCKPGENAEVCWCDPDSDGKCWLKSQMTETVHHILKGGEDSIGVEGALQRVFFNIGTCAEACWDNHLTDLRQLDPQQRNFGQTPFDIGQCRRDCPNLRAIEDRLPELASFVLSKEGRATDLAVARDPDPSRSLAQKRRKLVDSLEKEFGAGAVARGREVFSETCARCHSTQEDTGDKRDFLKEQPGDPSLRVDWLGSDQAIPASQVGTFACRALHSNHMEGHVWSEFASRTYQTRSPDRNLDDVSGGGRGYLRVVSLVSLWAHAPFLHNNAVGPELCGKPKDPRDDFYRSPYVDGSGHLLADPPACVQYDPSVAGRYTLFKRSIESLLNPSTRISKMSLLDRPIRLDLGPRTWDGNKEKRIAGITIEFPPGTPASFFGNFKHKELVIDLVLAKTDEPGLRARLRERSVDDKEMDATVKELRAIADEILQHPSQFVTLARQRMPLLEKLYLACRGTIENAGHRFGEDLKAGDKKALTAFLATL